MELTVLSMEEVLGEFEQMSDDEVYVIKASHWSSEKYEMVPFSKASVEDVRNGLVVRIG